LKSSLGEFQPTILVVCSDENDVKRLLLSGAFQLTAKRIKLICIIPHDTHTKRIIRLNELYGDSQIIRVRLKKKTQIFTDLIALHQPLMVVVGLGLRPGITTRAIAACSALETFSIVIQTSKTKSLHSKRKRRKIISGMSALRNKAASLLATSRSFKIAPDSAMLWNKGALAMAKKSLGVVKKNAFVLGLQKQTDYSSKLDDLVSRNFEIRALKLRRKKAAGRASISHHQGADRVLARYANIEMGGVHVEGVVWVKFIWV